MTDIQIKCFMAAVKNGSLAGAAKELYLSTQVVSQHIQHLENELGTVLFVRATGGVILTQDGQSFYHYAAEMVGMYDSTMRSIKETYRSISSSLKIGISDYIDYMGEINGGILSFTDSHTNVTVNGSQLKSYDLLGKIDNFDIDVAIIPDSQIVSSGDYDVVPFAAEDLHLFISPSPEDTEDLTIGSEKLNALCSSLPQMNTSYGVWTSKEWTEVSSRMTDSQRFISKFFYEMPNFRSAVLNLKYINAMVVCDTRFGYRIDDSVFNVPLGIKSSLCCVWHKRNENALIKEFAQHMKKYYE